MANLQEIMIEACCGKSFHVKKGQFISVINVVLNIFNKKTKKEVMLRQKFLP